MRTYTTCPGCGDVLLYQGRHARTHPGCRDPQQWELDLEDRFIAAAERGDDAEANRLGAELDALDDRPPRLAEAALAYAALGWNVFPLRPGDKIPFRRSRGCKDATVDPVKIREWWTRWPGANIGVPTGITFDAIDVDFRHGALPAWQALRDCDAMPDVHAVASTAHNGMHVLITPGGGGNLAHVASLPGLDFRGRGGYIVVAPSVLADGRRYLWDVKPSPAITRRP